MYSKLTERQTEFLLNIRKATLEVCKAGCRYGIKPDGSKCACRKMFDWVLHLVSANIPKQYWSLDIVDLDIPVGVKNLVISALNNYETMLSEGLGFIFSGSHGIGKTSLLSEIGKHFLIKKKKVFYVLADNLVQSVMHPEVLNTEYPLKYFDVLLVDELDKVYVKHGSDYALKELEKFFRDTLPYGKLVCTAMNYTEEEFARKFGVSTISMIRRHLKFAEFRQEDKSHDLQDKWMDRLTSIGDVLKHKNMIEAAERFSK